MTILDETFADATTTAGLTRPGAWTRDAACGLSDIDRLDPIVGGKPTPTEMRVRLTAAQELCATCPVRRVCGAEADLHGDEGVRGGSLRYTVLDPEHEFSGHYLAERLIPNAAPSVYERGPIRERLARKRAVAASARIEADK
jgi:hypothetical protein